MGERDAQPGRQGALDDHSGDLVAEHRAHGAPPGRSFSTSLPHRPQARTRTRMPPGGAMGEGSSRSAGDPPGVTVTASMSAQSLVASRGVSLGLGRSRELATVAPAASARACGSTRNTACGAPAAAHT